MFYSKALTLDLNRTPSKQAALILGLPNGEEVGVLILLLVVSASKTITKLLFGVVRNFCWLYMG